MSVLISVDRGPSGGLVVTTESNQQTTLSKSEGKSLRKKLRFNWIDESKLSSGITVRKVVDECVWDNYCRGSMR